MKTTNIFVVVLHDTDDHYIILDLDFKTSTKEVTTKYRLLASIYHLDKFDDKNLFTSEECEEIFKSISNACESLIDSNTLL